MWQTKTKLFGGMSTLFACLLFIYLGNLSMAQVAPASPWLSTGNPSIEKIADIDTSQPYPANIISNSDCTERELVLQPRRYIAPLQKKISQPGCVVDTGYGSLAGSGYMQRAGSSIYGPVKNSFGGTAIMLPAPRSSTGIRFGSAPGNGVYLFFYDDLETKLTSSADFTGQVTHKLPAEYSTMLKDKANNLLEVDTTGTSFSPDGQWMVADIPFVAMARINIKTREVLPFGDATNYNIGLGPAYKTAISPNGRYAVIASRNFEIFKLYDLSTCGQVPNKITTKVNCEWRDLLPFVRQKIPGFTSVASMRLNDDFTINLYANSITGSPTLASSYKLTQYLVTAAGQQAVGYQYLALGDSFASGEGAYEYKAFTDTSDNKCHLSQRSYPYLISSVLGYGKYESVACSGAVIEDVTNNSESYRRDNSQAKGKFEDSFENEIYSSFLPGYRAQKTFVTKNIPNIITLSAGGNDIGFSDIILRCIDTDTCYDNFEDRLELAELINKQFHPLAKMYNEVKASTDPRAKIYVIGYPQIASTEGVCDLNVHLNRAERVFAQQLVSYLNDVIKKAAQNSGVYYVDVEYAFNGHKLCDDVPSWRVAVNGLTAGNDQLNLPFIHGPIGNEIYHPNAQGQYMLQLKILASTGNFTANMPAPNPNVTVSDPDLNSDFLKIAKSNRIIRNLKHYTGTDGGVLRAGYRWVWDASNLDTVFAAGSSVQAWINSTPTYLGSYTLGAGGTLNIASNIPSTLTLGFHTLHLYGKNSSGEDIDVFKTVYVDTGSLYLVPTSGQDTDKDGTDDACDGLIAQPPIVVVPSPAEPKKVTIATPASQQSIATQENTNTQTTKSPVVLAQNTQPTVPAQTTIIPSTTTQGTQPSVLSATTQTNNPEPAEPQIPTPTTAAKTLATQTPEAKSPKFKLNGYTILTIVLVAIACIFILFIIAL